MILSMCTRRTASSRSDAAKFASVTTCDLKFIKFPLNTHKAPELLLRKSPDIYSRRGTYRGTPLELPWNSPQDRKLRFAFSFDLTHTAEWSAWTGYMDFFLNARMQQEMQ